MGMTEKDLMAFQQADPEGSLAAGVAAAFGQIKGLSGEDQTAYQIARANFTGVRVQGPLLGTGGPATGVNRDIVQTAPNGMVLYANGVIFNPETQGLIFPPGMAQAETPGSELWLQGIQETWGEDQTDKWRKKLYEQGYEVAEEGGWGKDLKDALRVYHANRYANGGKAIPLVPGGKKSMKPSIRESIDPLLLKTKMKGWGTAVFGEELAEPEADYFTERFIDEMVELNRKQGGKWSPKQIEQGAYARVEKEFLNNKNVKGELRDAEEDEMDESLRESIVSVSQLVL